MKRLVLTLTASVPLIIGGVACGRLLADNEEKGGAFEYRDIYLPEYNTKANAALGLDIVDDDWGIWGHNLGNVLPDNPSIQVYAKAGGGTNRDQFCFSSDKLYKYIVDYIHGNYMFDKGKKFAILPNDNDVVCLCAECIASGNTEKNASPAVLKMIERLAKKFPEHEFYTSYYSTTRDVPSKVMPPNTGVIVSAIEFPLSPCENSKEVSFLTLIEQWKEKTDKIVIWDYINNYDDYFTPSPIFSIMQRRLGMYRDAGVSGVFLNGSGNDYSTFSDIKKAVLARLLENPDLDWEELIRTYATEYYPKSGNIIADFMIRQEKMIQTNCKPLPEYEGVYNARNTYLPEKEFVDFYVQLANLRRDTEGEEKEKLRKAVNAMSYTILELKRIHGNIEGTEKAKESLAKLPLKGVRYYNEGAWSIDQYLQDYEFMEKDAAETASTNLLKGVKIRPLSALDEDYTDINILTDGLLGIPSNYHSGNLITSADPAFSVSIPRQEGMKKLKVWLTYNPGFKIGLPAEVYISTDGVKSSRVTPEKPVGTGHASVEFNVPAGGGDVILTLVKDPDVKTMAIDEIQAFR